MSVSNLDLDKLSSQEEVFKRWINYILLMKKVKIENFYDDLGNGVYIVYLIEALTTHDFKYKIKNPNFRTQKMENITMVLKYLQENERMKFLNIDSSNILNKETKIVLSFVWHIIEYFSINKPLDAHFLDQHNKSPGKSTKQKFMNWLKSRVPMTLKNLTNDCKNGVVIGALVNSFNTNLCSDWPTWSTKGTLNNVKMSIETAERELGVPPLILAEELFSGKLDEKSMMTYFSQFIPCKTSPVLQVVELRGLDKPNYAVNCVVSFSMHASSYDSLSVQVTDPSGKMTPLKYKDPLEDMCGGLQFSLVPHLPGQYTIVVVSNTTDKPVVSSTIFVDTVTDSREMNNLDMEADRVYLEGALHVKGRGIQAVGIRCGDSVEFKIEILNNKKLRPEDVIVQISAPEGSPLQFHREGRDDCVLCSYKPEAVGIYEIIVLIQLSMFRKVFLVKVGDTCPVEIIAVGPGLHFATCHGAAVFTVETNGATGTLNFTIEGPDEAKIECKDNRDGSATVSYWPITPGEYAIHILYENEDIRHSPFMVDVRSPCNGLKPCKVKAYGAALCEARLIVGEVGHFTVDVTKGNGGLDPLFVYCVDKRGETVQINVLSDISYKRTFSLVPLSSLRLTMWICYDGICVSGSPFTICVADSGLANNIRVQGSGLHAACGGLEAIFFVDCRLVSKEGDLQVVITDSNLCQVPCQIERNTNDGQIYSVKYVPGFNIARCFIDIMYANTSVYDEPFVVMVTRPPSGYPSLPADDRNCRTFVDKDGTDFCRPPFQNFGSSFDSLRDYSDIFLDPRAESYLKVVVPLGRDSQIIALSDLPLPPPDFTNDSGDTSMENLPSKYPLSTVQEESEENYSVKDSIFSSDCHSRSSTKDDFPSLSRRSSMTLTQSPSAMMAMGYLKRDITANLSEFISDESYSSLNFVSLRSTNTFSDIMEDIIKFPNSIPLRPVTPSFPDMYESDDLFPLPEPPLDCDLLCCNRKQMAHPCSSLLHKMNVELEEIGRLDCVCRTVSSLTKERDFTNSFISTEDYLFKLLISDQMINFNNFSRPDEIVFRILFSDSVVCGQNVRDDNMSTEERIESEMSFSEMLPVTQLEAIISPFDGASNYLSDTSDNSLASGNNSVLLTAYCNQLSSPFDDLLQELGQADSVDIDKLQVMKHQRASFRIIKEMTTSEVSEISDTSLWVSNEENAVNDPQQAEVHSISDLPKSGACDNLYGANFLSEYCTAKVSRSHDVAINARRSLNCNVVENSVNCNISVNTSRQWDSVMVPHKHVSWDCPDLRWTHDLVKNGSDAGISSDRSTSFSPSEVNLERTDACKDSGDALSSSEVERIFANEASPSSKSNDRSDVSCAFLKVCETDRDLQNAANVSSFFVNKPLLVTPEICSNGSVTRLSIDTTPRLPSDNEAGVCTSKRTKMASLSSGSVISSDGDPIKTPHIPKNISFNTPKPTTFHPRKIQCKRRSLSQSYSYVSPIDLCDPVTNDHTQDDLLESGPRIYNKNHVRAFSESDHQDICSVDFQRKEEEPIKLKRNICDKMKCCTDSASTVVYPRSSTVLSDDRGRSWWVANKCGSNQHAASLNTVPGTGITVTGISVFGEGLYSALVDDVAEFLLRTNGNGTEGISISIEGPSKTEMETIGLPNGDCKVKYIPRLPGDYFLSVQQYSLHIFGSPFTVNVPAVSERLADACNSVIPSYKVYAEGQGLTSAYKNFPNQFIIYTKESGPGGLSLSIEGPSKAVIEFQECRGGACGVTYRVTESGLYTCIVKFNKNHIKDSPFSINVTCQPPVPFNVEENKLPLDKSKPIFEVGKRALFKIHSENIDMTRISKLTAVLCCPVKTIKQLKVRKDTENGYLWVEFTPHVDGCHMLHFLDESQRNEPTSDSNTFLLIVERPTPLDGTCFERELVSIRVYGKGLISGRAGCSNIFFIEIGESVSGALNVTVDGPSKVEIKCNETDKGFKFSYIPAVLGDYFVTIKYGGERQIKGSPFQVKIIRSSKSNKHNSSRRKFRSSTANQLSMTDLSNSVREPSVISCYGSGLYKGKMDMWMDFYVDASKTSVTNHLFVGIIGPIEPCVEIRILHSDNRRYLVSYRPAERGLHSLIVRWGEEHLSCSPGTIEIE